MNKSVILISPCCGRGFYQAKKLIQRLNTEHVTYDLHQVKPSQAQELLSKHGLTAEEVKKTKTPYLILDGLCIKAEAINDDSYLNDLAGKLKTIKGAETQQAFLNKVENK